MGEFQALQLFYRKRLEGMLEHFDVQWALEKQQFHLSLTILLTFLIQVNIIAEDHSTGQHKFIFSTQTPIRHISPSANYF